MCKVKDELINKEEKLFSYNEKEELQQPKQEQDEIELMDDFQARMDVVDMKIDFAQDGGLVI